jgi:hypothetical protein
MILSPHPLHYIPDSKLLNFLVVLSLVSCYSQKKDYSENDFSTVFPVVTQTPTLNIPIVTPTVTADPYSYPISQVATNCPIQLQPQVSAETGYLYHNYQVTVTLVDRFDAYVYLNLDDLTNNSIGESDIAINRTFGSDMPFILYPINHSNYYAISAQDQPDLSTCRQYFPIENISKVEYQLQETHFMTGKPYCILTNQQRIAVVNLVLGSIENVPGDDFAQTLMVNVTVFDALVNN